MDPSPLVKVLEDLPPIVGGGLDACDLDVVCGLPKLQPHGWKAYLALVRVKLDQSLQVQQP